MTTVTILKDSNGSYRGFICMGHAGYAKKNIFGKRQPDVLCAAISTLATATNNALEALAGEQVETVVNEEDGFLKCMFESVLQEKSVFLMDSFIFALESLNREYGDRYLQVKFEEV